MNKKIILIGVLILLICGCSRCFTPDECQEVINKFNKFREDYHYNFVWNCSGVKTISINTKTAFEELKNKGCDFVGLG